MLFFNVSMLEWPGLAPRLELLTHSIQKECPMGWWLRINKMSDLFHRSFYHNIKAWVVVRWWSFSVTRRPELIKINSN